MGLACAAVVSATLWAGAPAFGAGPHDAGKTTTAPPASQDYDTSGDIAVTLVVRTCLAGDGSARAIAKAAEDIGMPKPEEQAIPAEVDRTQISMERLMISGVGSRDGEVHLTLIDAALKAGRTKVRWGQCNIRFNPGEEPIAMRTLETQFGPATARKGERGGHSWAFRLKGETRTPTPVGEFDTPTEAAKAVAADGRGQGRLVVVSTIDDGEGYVSILVNSYAVD